MKNNISIFMCEPKHYDIVYEINPWMNKQHGAEKHLARQQWNNLKNLIEQCGAQVKLVEPAEGWPDMVFTANAGLLFGKKVFLANFKFPERKGEREYFLTWFQQAGFEIIDDQSNIDFEGAGDTLFAGNKLFAASGFRSDPEIYKHIARMGNFEIVQVQLCDPYFYHLDTCFCPLNDKQAIWWPGAFTKDSQEILQNNIELFAVPEQDAKKFACNAVVINNHVIIPAGCDATQQILEKLGFTVHQTEMSEYIKAGGACKCLTLKL